MKPLIVYVDDAPGALTVFEMELSDDFEVKTHTDPLKALADLQTLTPAIVVSDQRMPGGMNGVAYLELVAKLRPDAVRILMTGYTDEDTMIEALQKAQIFDYIRKPLGEGVLQARIARAYEYYKAQEEKRQLEETLRKQNEELRKLADDLKASRQEIAAFIHPSFRKLLDRKQTFPCQKDLVGVTFDVISGSDYHDVVVETSRGPRQLMSILIESFSVAVLKFGGCRESLPGDSVYAHFGLDPEAHDPFHSALAAAQEFRQALRSISSLHSVQVECGIALHFGKGCTVEIHEASVQDADRLVTQKSFGTHSIDIDLLHRLEKEAHALTGSNILISGEFVANLKNPPPNLKRLGQKVFRGQKRSTEIFILPSDRLMPEDLARVQADLAGGESSSKKSKRPKAA